MSKKALNSKVKSITRKEFLDAWYTENVVHVDVHEKDSEGELATVIVLIDGNYYQADTYLAYGSHTLSHYTVHTEPVQVFPKQKVITVYEPLGGE